jgi:hypothetical protein
VQAALLPGAQAISAWQRLAELTNYLDETDAAVFRTLPLVYRNLRAAGLSESDVGPLKGVYRQSWYRIRLSLAPALEALSHLQRAGIEPVALKGLGLVATIYPEPALRPMADSDLLFRPGEHTRAVDALLEAGWRVVRGARDDYLRRIRVFHALPLVSPQGFEIDLHRYMLEENCVAGADSPLFDRAVRGSVSEHSVLSLSPEDHVLNACVHGVRWDPVPALRWLPDTVSAIRSRGDSFEWDYLLEEGKRRRVGLALGAALRFATDFEPSIPERIVEALIDSAGRVERWDFRMQQGSDGVTNQVGRYLTRYARLTRGRSVVRKAADFPTYLECMWELDRPRQVPLDGVRRVSARLRGRTPGRPQIKQPD